jgi:chromosome segregation ATPase
LATSLSRIESAANSDGSCDDSAGSGSVESKFAALRRDNAELRTRVVELEQALAAIRGSLAISTDPAPGSASPLDQIQAIIEERDRRLRELEGALASVREMVGGGEDGSDGFDPLKVKSLVGGLVDELRAENSKQSQRIDELQSGFRRLHSNIVQDEISEPDVDVPAAVARIEEVVAALRSEQADQEDQIRQLQGSLAQLQAAISGDGSSEGGLSAFESKLKAERQEAAEVAAAKRDLERRLEERSSELEAERQRVSELGDSNRELESEIASRDERIRELGDSNRELGFVIASRDERIRELGDSNRELESVIAARDERVRELGDANRELESVIAARDERIRELE